MTTRFPAVTAAILFLLSGAAHAGENACAASWKTDIQPIVNANCVACHQDAAPAGNLTLQRGKPPANLIGVKSDEAPLPYVTPGDPSKSYIFRKISGTHLEAGGMGAQMPLGGQLAEADIAAIAAWIKSCITP